MSSSSSVSTLAAALGSPPSQHLTRNNFLLWQALIVPAFRGANVMGLLDGSDGAPAKTIEVDDTDGKKVQVDNPAYLTWIARDQHVLRFLLNSLSPEILSHVLGMDTTAMAWSAINAMFKTASRTKAQHLREKLNDTKKLTMTADQYYTKMKGFASELSALGKPVGDDELLGYLLHGLDKVEYNSLITSVHGNSSTTIDDFYEQLSGYDMRNGVEENGMFVSSANLARRGYVPPRGRTPPPLSRGYSPPPRGGDDRYRGGGGGSGDRYRERDDDRSWRRDDRRDDDRPWKRDDRRDDDRRGDRRDRRNDGGGGRRDRVPTRYVNTECQICKKHGHPASECWWRYSDDKKKRDDAEKGAHLASYGVDTNWYADSGATDHITSELNKLLIANKYHGQDNVRTAEEGTQNIDNHVPVIVPITDVQQGPEAAGTNAGETALSSPEFSFEFSAEEDEIGADSRDDSVRHSPGRADPQVDPPGHADPEVGARGRHPPSSSPEAGSRGPSPPTRSSSPSPEASARGENASSPPYPGPASGSSPRGADSSDSCSSSLSSAPGSSVAGSGGGENVAEDEELIEVNNNDNGDDGTSDSSSSIPDSPVQNVAVQNVGVHTRLQKDWAGSIDDRRSTGGFAIFVGPNLRPPRFPPARSAGGGRRLLLASSSLAPGANRRFRAMATVALGECTVEWGVDWRDRPLQSTFNKPPRSPIGGPKGDEQVSGRTRPDTACHPRPRKPSPDLGRVCVVPDAAAIRIWGAPPRWAEFLSG
ncbi:hypothetical protein QYE76_031393 [Lolium multiflorum]|uniref:Retrotransposon Copia-like N-terminal domain-containing protein n=1 Tax=Lolium multiflorum TaxID=4521 RepID=A0AAD8QSR6_LOLMU|nr:hypothetical protein QYE76_031393 [Lolium multiflorum]